VCLAEIGREETKATADVENAAFVRQEQVHHAEELGPEDRKADARVDALDPRETANDAINRDVSEYFWRD